MKKAIALLLSLSVVISLCSIPGGAVGTEKIDIKSYSAVLANPGSPSEQYYWVDEDGNTVDFPGRASASNGLFTRSKNSSGELPDSFDLRNYNGTSYVTSVKNQGKTSSCWAVAALGSIESNYLLDGASSAAEPDFSEAHMVWFAMRGQTDDTTDLTYGDGYNIAYPYDEGGFWGDVTSVLSRGSGVVYEADFPFYPNDVSSMGNYPESARYLSEAHLNEVNLFDGTDIAAVKQSLMQNGAMTSSLYYDDLYLSSTNAYYYPGMQYSNHDILVVGWDDNYPKSNFNAAALLAYPSSNGAWLCRNSWGNGWGDDGYFWISYESKSLSNFVSYDISDEDNIDNIYQYDAHCYMNFLSVSDRDNLEFGNVYTARGDEDLTAVGFYTLQNDLEYTVTVYTDVAEGAVSPNQGAMVESSSTTGTIDYTGYHNVTLSSPVELTEGMRYSVLVELRSKNGAEVGVMIEGVSNPEAFYSFSSNKGESFIGADNQWLDISDYGSNNVCLKAFTANRVEPIEFSLNLSKATLVEGNLFVLYAKNAPEGVDISWFSSDTTVAVVDENGIITAVAPGNAEITAKITVDQAGDEFEYTAVCAVSVREKPDDPQVVDPSVQPHTVLDKIVEFFRLIVEFILKLFRIR